MEDIKSTSSWIFKSTSYKRQIQPTYKLKVQERIDFIERKPLGFLFFVVLFSLNEVNVFIYLILFVCCGQFFFFAYD